MAPNAKIILVKACSISLADLYYAQTVAHGLIAVAGGGDISDSWSTAEYAGETAGDFNFFFYLDQLPGPSSIVIFASTGDAGCGAQYPSSSPWVVSAGGTRVNRGALGYFQNESCWSLSGGGIGTQETGRILSRAEIRGRGPTFNTPCSVATTQAHLTVPHLTCPSTPIQPAGYLSLANITAADSRSGAPVSQRRHWPASSTMPTG
jgi:subtilase family serine protease